MFTFHFCHHYKYTFLIYILIIEYFVTYFKISYHNKHGVIISEDLWFCSVGNKGFIWIEKNTHIFSYQDLKVSVLFQSSLHVSYLNIISPLTCISLHSNPTSAFLSIYTKNKTTVIQRYYIWLFCFNSGSKPAICMR